MQSVEKKTASGIIWRYAEEISTKVVTFVVTILLARILMPENYTVVSLATIIISCVNSVVDGGLSSAVIQKGNADREDYETLMSFGIFASVIIYLLIFFAAPAISRLYGGDEVTNILRVLCLVIIIRAVKNVYLTKICSDLQFKKLFFSSFIGTACSAVVGITLARGGCGAWALVAQHLTDAVIDTVIMRATTHFKVLPRFSMPRFKALFSYSSKILISGIFARLTNALSPVLISLRYSAVDMTYYTKAHMLSGYMLSFIETPLSQVLFPVLSKMKDDRARLLALQRKFYRILYFFTLPALCGLYVTADDLVTLLLTDKWSALVPYLRIFIIAMLFNKNINGIKSIGRSDLYMKAQMIQRTLGIVYLLIALIFFDSPLAVVWACVPKSVTYFIAQIYLEKRYLGYKVSDQMKDMLPSLALSVIMAAAVYMTAQTPIVSTLGTVARFAAQALTGCAVYAALALVFRRKLFASNR